MRKKLSLLNLVGGFLLASFFAKASLGCGGMTFPGSLLCSPTTGGAYTSGYPTLTASIVYVPTSLLGGSSQPVAYPPNPLAPKTPVTTATNSYPYYYNAYPSYGYGTSYPAYGSGCGSPSYGLTSGLFGGLGACGGGTSVLSPSYGLSSGYGYPVMSYPVTSSPALTVASPSTHGCSPTGAISGAPVFSAPRPVCVQFCGAARNLMRPISRGRSLTSNRLY